eukprot:4209802-Prymnesium_polylepis.1
MTPLSPPRRAATLSLAQAPAAEVKRQTGLESAMHRTGARARTVVRGMRYEAPDAAPMHKPVRRLHRSPAWHTLPLAARLHRPRLHTVAYAHGASLRDAPHLPL